MPKVVVKDGEINEAMKKFSRITSETRKSAKRHEYYLRPGLRAKEKSKLAKRHNAKRKMIISSSNKSSNQSTPNSSTNSNV